MVIALIDGPVNRRLSQFGSSTIQEISSSVSGACNQQASACMHGTLVAGVLVGSRGSAAPAICPACTLLVRPIFEAANAGDNNASNAHPESLAAAIIECVKAGARIINLSCGIARCPARGEGSIRDALAFAANKGAIVVAAAGNQATVGGSCITNDPWVIPVIALDKSGAAAYDSNLSASIGQRGLGAPGEDIPSVSPTGASTIFSGTSAACPFVSGAAALLWSEFPALSGVQIRRALTGGKRPRTIVPPAMDAWRAFKSLDAQTVGRKAS